LYRNFTIPLYTRCHFLSGGAMDSRRSLMNFALINRSANSATLLALILILSVTIAHDAQAQTFSVLHYFTGGTDGETPYAGLTVSSSGALYGTAADGGTHGVGTVFKMNQVNSSWVFSALYEFDGVNGGSFPLGAVVIGPNGALYGTTFGVGITGPYGTVFELTPPATFCRGVLCYWNEHVLHTFADVAGGTGPQAVSLAFDSAGKIYGTTGGGGLYNSGATFELTPTSGGYTESLLHSFGNGTDGRDPLAGVVLDAAGNVYGTTLLGGTGSLQTCHGTCGTVYQLVPSNGGWVENVLVNFEVTNGQHPYGNLIIDGSGNLYGTTASGGQNGGGVVYKLASSGGGFTFSLLYSFNSCGSRGGLTMDAAGNLFGVCYDGGAHQDGWIFELTNCSQSCNLVDLHDFSGSDGMNPYGSPALDPSGNLYGTADAGGTGCPQGCGVVWEIAGVGAPRRR
jgi:uncharacterized repeat protein (TIGR03803 family)